MQHYKTGAIGSVIKRKKSRKRIDKKILIGMSIIILASYIWGPNITNKLVEEYQRRREAKRTFSCGYSIDINDEGLTINFRNNKFRIERVEVPKYIKMEGKQHIATLDGMLYDLHYEKNHKLHPDFKIRGDRLERLKDLFYLMRECIKNSGLDISNLEKLSQGHFEFASPSIKRDSALKAGNIHYFPYYVVNDQKIQ